ncbi:hypothetical protein HHL17_06280 [Chitinophaga sp. G-6-1-13]|uniref:WD40-like Beta Propeller Repeat n=1 Tax=Chitinophaga fulva TaxID=2728842 RepID=A0A848GJB2_9BACT|nr:hypothetical protein [Chitinophaga fulva]NML36800.1 hypothetical protein [Chitinophaga fulva]
MKKLILGSFALLMFSASMLIFQISCKKSAEAESPMPAVPVQINKVAFTRYSQNGGTEICVMNYDGTGLVKVPVQLGANQSITDEVRLSPDGRKVFFVLYTPGTNETKKEDIYSCDIDGKNQKKIYGMPDGGGNTILGGAY